MRRVTLFPIALALTLGILLSIATTATTAVNQEAGDALRLAQQCPTPTPTPTPEIRARVENVRMSDVPHGSAKSNFRPGTTTVYLVFDYEHLSQNEIGVQVADDVGIVILDQIETLSGSGTKSVEITGSRVFVAYFDAAETYGENMQDRIDAAIAGPDSQITDTVQIALTQGRQMEVALQRLRLFPVSAETRGHLDDALTEVGLAVSEGEEAIEPGKSMAEIRAHLQSMKTHADAAVSHTQLARRPDISHLGHKLYLPLMVKGGGSLFALLATSSCQTNVSNVLLDAFLAGTAEWTVGEPGVPQAVEVDTKPATIYTTDVTCGVHSAVVEAKVTDANCLPVADGTQVIFSTSDPARGTVFPTTATTTNGIATTTVSAGAEVGDGTLIITATAGSVSNTDIVTLGGPPNQVTVRTESDNILIGGIWPCPTPPAPGATACCGVQAEVKDQNGRLVADWTEVSFAVEPSTRGVFNPVRARTVDGTASSTLVSGNTTGMATIRVTADGAQGTKEVRFVGPVETVTVTADPSDIPASGPSAHAEIRVEVQDANGDPAADGTRVYLSLDPPWLGFFAAETLTLRDGFATTTLYAEGEEGTATVRATADSKEGTVTVNFIAP